MNKLLIFAKSIDDFRMDRKKLHLVENIVFITVIAVICNASDWGKIEDFNCIKKLSFSDSLIDIYETKIIQKNIPPALFR